MKTTLIISLFLLAVSLFTFLPQAAAVNTSEWNLPEGAKARLGKGGINDITCSSDGALLAVASQIGIWIYDIQTREALALLTGHTGAVDRISFSPDGRTLASGGQDNRVRLWDVATQTEIGTLEGHTGGPDTIFFSSDGRTLASRDDDNTLRLWDMETQTQIHTLEGHTGSLESVSFSPDGKMIASGGQDEIVRLWDVATRTEIGRLEGHTEYVSSVSFSPDGKTIASGSDDNTVRLWDVATRTEIGKLEGHTWGVNSVVFSSDGKTLASGSDDNTVRLWDVDTRAEIGILERSTPLLRVSFSPDGQTIAGMYTWVGYTVDLWDVDTQTRKQGFSNDEIFVRRVLDEYTIWEVLWVVAAQAENIHTILVGHTDAILSVSFSPDGKTIAASYDPKEYQGSYFLRMWDVATLTEIDTLDRWGSRSFGNESVSFSPDGKTILSRCGQRVICLRDAATYTEIGTLEIPSHWVNIAVFSPDGHTLAIRGGGYYGDRGYRGEIVRLWDVDTDTEIGRLWGHIDNVNSLSFSPDGRTLASGGQDNIVRLWDVDTRTEIGILEGHTGYVSSVSFSPDGKTIASGSDDNTVRLWDVATRTEIGKLEGHTWGVNSVVFSSDGKTLASGSDDNTVRLWDVDTRAEIGILERSTPLLRVSFSPDGQTIAGMYTWVGYTVDLWDVDTQTRKQGFSNDGIFVRRVLDEYTIWEVLWVVAAQAENIHTILVGHTDAILSVSFSPDGKTIAASYDPKEYQGSYFLRMWDVATLTEIDTLTYPWGDRSYAGSRSFGNKNVAFSPDGKTILSRCGQRVICLRDAATYTEIGTLEIPSHWVNIAVFSPDGHTLAIRGGGYYGDRGYRGEIVRLWDVDTDTEIGRLWGHIDNVNSLSFHPDGRTLATAGSVDATVRIWDVDTQTEIGILRGHTGWVNSVSFSPDGKTIVSGSNDSTVRIWDVATRTEIGTLEGHTAAVNSVAFHPGGKTIVSGSNGRTVRIWDVDTLTEIGTLEGHTDAVRSVSFSPDGKTLASGSDDGTVLLWELPQLTTETKNIAADVNMDGVVNIQDLVIVANAFGAAEPDLNGDGVVNILDLVIVAQNFK